MISPTGKGLRQPDDFGAGHYGAPRGDSIHRGVDFACEPGQDVVSPASLDVLRASYPYSDDPRWHGLLLRHPYYDLYIWYIEPLWELIGSRVRQGQIIGVAQDISEKYNTDTKKMNPHVHLQMKSVDFTKFLMTGY